MGTNEKRSRVVRDGESTATNGTRSFRNVRIFGTPRVPVIRTFSAAVRIAVSYTGERKTYNRYVFENGRYLRIREGIFR